MATLFGDSERYAAGLTHAAPGVHAWLQSNDAWGESNAGLVVGDDESLLVDTLWHPALTRMMLEAMGPLTDGEVVELALDGIGTLRDRVVVAAEPA
jgi:hypothetical protein